MVDIATRYDFVHAYGFFLEILTDYRFAVGDHGTGHASFLVKQNEYIQLVRSFLEET